MFVLKSVILLYDKSNSFNWFVSKLYDIFFREKTHITLVNKEQLQIKMGKRIIKLRESLGWTQADLARACMKDRQAIEKLENGKVNTTLYTLWELASAMGLPLADFTQDL